MALWRMRWRLFSAALCVPLALSSAWATASETRVNDAPADAARRVDRLLEEEVFAKISADQLAPQTDDATFARRVSLDLAGHLPTPGELTALVLDVDPDKRAKLVDRLLDDPRFGRNWARYWRDVIMSRRADERSLLVSDPLEEFLTEEFNSNAAWDEIAQSFIAAYGDVREQGSTALVMAQMATTEDVASEVSRIFLGIQIQCAQCHDHPTDRWTREQFHEFAAFFPRVGVVPKRPPGGAFPIVAMRSFEVRALDSAPRFLLERAGKKLEHHMPDLADASAAGTPMTPVFFATSQSLRQGATDRERREALAQWLTSRDNPWFAKALVNRVWSELVGEGFYEPVDDLGPDRECTAHGAIDYLATQFAIDYDLKWLYRTVMATKAYQRASRPRRNPDETPFTANVAQRLRADQIYDVLTTAIGMSQLPLGMGAQRGPQYMRPFGRPRVAFNQAFTFDPSDRREEITGSIPQALVMMNSDGVRQAINAKARTTVLGRLVLAVADDEEVVLELYLRTLGREPHGIELSTALAHVRATTDRGEAFEDLFWALVNRAEFVYRY